MTQVGRTLYQLGETQTEIEPGAAAPGRLIAMYVQNDRLTRLLVQSAIDGQPDFRGQTLLQLVAAANPLAQIHGTPVSRPAFQPPAWGQYTVGDGDQQRTRRRSYPRKSTPSW